MNLYLAVMRGVKVGGKGKLGVTIRNSNTATRLQALLEQATIDD